MLETNITFVPWRWRQLYPLVATQIVTLEKISYRLRLLSSSLAYFSTTKMEVNCPSKRFPSSELHGDINQGTLLYTVTAMETWNRIVKHEFFCFHISLANLCRFSSWLLKYQIRTDKTPAVVPFWITPYSLVCTYKSYRRNSIFKRTNGSRVQDYTIS
jgi:hypothetical protein